MLNTTLQCPSYRGIFFIHINQRAMLTIVALLLLFQGFSQDKQFVSQMMNRIDSFYQLTPLEKAYIHTDKEWYMTGENIWFKAYTTVDNALGSLSGVFYVDLIDEKDSAVIKTMWKVSNNSFKGDIYLPIELAEGSYKLKVYSLWMLNTPEVIYEKYIQIFSTKTSSSSGQKNSTLPVRVHLFPEGGYLVNGLQSKIGFKVTDQYGLPIEKVKMQLEENGAVILVDSATHNGMGTFVFSPDQSKKYTCKFKVNGVWYVPDFPSISESGLVLSVNALSNNHLFFTIQRPALLSNKNIPAVWLVGHIGGVSYYAQKIILEDSVTAGAIPIKNLPHGVMNLTLFNENNLPDIERLVFIRKVTAIAPEISVVRKGLSKKEKNVFSIKISSDTAMLSISVASAESIKNRFSNASIADYLLFKSEVKGYVHDPAFYFQSNDSLHRAALDMLLLTQGWRRFMWKDVQANELPKLNYFIETGISVRGSVIQEASGPKSVKDARVDFIIKGDDSTSIVAGADIQDRGQFILNDLFFRKRASVFYKGSMMNTLNPLQVSIHPNYIDTLKTHKRGWVDISMPAELEPEKRTSLMGQYFNGPIVTGSNLKEVTVYTKMKTPEQKLTDEYVSDWYKTSDFTLIPDSLSGFSSIWQWLQGRIPGLTISGDMFNPTVNFTRYQGGITDPSLLMESVYETLNTINGEVKSRIAFFLNEMPVSIDQINSLSPKDIALVKVNRTPNLVGNATAGSMFLYTTRTFSNNNFKKMNKTTISGYSVSKEYFSPVYETPESRNITDKRSSLYWNPNPIIINGKSDFIFYNSDTATKYKIVVEGLTKGGIPIYADLLVE